MSEQVWILDDDNAIRWVLKRAMVNHQISHASFSDATSLWEALTLSQPKVIISDIRMPQTDGLSLLKRLQEHYPHIPVIIMTAHSDLESAVNAYQAGAFDYLPKPFDIDDTLSLIERALKHAKDECSKTQLEPQTSSPEIIGEAPAMQEVFRVIGRLSKSSISVLINGQSGTGKELIAAALHKHSPRKDKPFIALNMAAIPQDLIESELFGHEKGAFTGATNIRHGRFEQADKGTLFLDEIGDMPIEVQTRLLRVLADGQFYRIGGHIPIQVDVRIIAATHQNIELKVFQGDFREDLFHRLNVIRIHIPSLAKRQQDIPSLADHFLSMAAKELSVEKKILTPAALEQLQALTWPGNVRQLENTCRWLTVMASGKEIWPQDLPPELVASENSDLNTKHEDWTIGLKQEITARLKAGDNNLLHDIQPRFEKAIIEAALIFSDGHKQDAAKCLGWGRNTLTRKIKEYAIK